MAQGISQKAINQNNGGTNEIFEIGIRQSDKCGRH